jgi:glycosyltransferase involved in cell wall biosynthesis
VYYSPHSSKALNSMSGLGMVLWWATRPVHNLARERPIVNMPVDARGLSGMLGEGSVELVESPVADVFFNVRRNETARPLVLTGSRLENPRSAELMAQLAVLLGDEDLGLSFNWIGETTSSSMQRLKAANVAVFEVPDEADRAHRLSRAWMYIAPGGTRGFPSFLVEAMAAGLPCIAMDTPYHRDFIRDGDTGYLCNSPEQVLDCVAQLIDFPELRQSMGAAAKAEARGRFDGGKFRDSLFAAYDIHPVS